MHAGTSCIKLKPQLHQLSQSTSAFVPHPLTRISIGSVAACGRGMVMRLTIAWLMVETLEDQLNFLQRKLATDLKYLNLSHVEIASTACF